MPTHTAIDRIIRDIGDKVDAIGRPVAVMEVCGTHTMAIHRHGLAAVMPAALKLSSGPGCPVCVTPSGYVDCALDLAKNDGVMIATFGDMVRVPGSDGTLEVARADGARVAIVQSPLEAVDAAAAQPDLDVVFLAIGFETTAPTIAAAVLEAEKQGVDNFHILAGGKVVPPALRALLQQPELGIDGLLLPGHVAIRELLEMIGDGRPDAANMYERVVRPDGNPRARQVMDRVFALRDDAWRGFGPIPDSGLGLQDGYRRFDVCAARGIEVPAGEEPAGCRCGDVVRGLIRPDECALFGKTCRPDHPIGPCMVSSEGTCAAHYKYGSGTGL